MGEVTDKFRAACDKLDGLPNYPKEWLSELYDIAAGMAEELIYIDESDSQVDLVYVDLFETFQKKYLNLKA
jgi:hypothetical protein